MLKLTSVYTFAHFRGSCVQHQVSFHLWNIFFLICTLQRVSQCSKILLFLYFFLVHRLATETNGWHYKLEPIQSFSISQIAMIVTKYAVSVCSMYGICISSCSRVKSSASNSVASRTLVKSLALQRESWLSTGRWKVTPQKN